MAGEEGVRQHLPLDAAAEGGAGLGAGEEAALRRVEADELHEGCGTVSLLDLAGSGGVVPGGVHRQKLYLPGGEQVDRRVQVLCVDQRNGGHGERLAPPPVAVGLEVVPLAAGDKEIGAGAGGHRLIFCAAFHHRDVQQGDEALVGGGEGEDHLPGGVAVGDGGHLPQPVAVPLRGGGPPQSGRYIGSGEGGTVAEKDPLADGESADQARLVPSIAGTQRRLRLKASIELEQGLEEQGGHVLLDALAAGDGVQGVVPVVG